MPQCAVSINRRLVGGPAKGRVAPGPPLLRPAVQRSAQHWRRRQRRWRRQRLASRQGRPDGLVPITFGKAACRPWKGLGESWVWGRAADPAAARLRHFVDLPHGRAALLEPQVAGTLVWHRHNSETLTAATSAQLAVPSAFPRSCVPSLHGHSNTAGAWCMERPAGPIGGKAELLKSECVHEWDGWGRMREGGKGVRGIQNRVLFSVFCGGGSSSHQERAYQSNLSRN